ncbi:MAG: hypothetical protein JSW09_00630 [Pseudomonadota bacterium]|nr:MAG: hypothetical protein JSW09_00630 [Pseudomonadota bacterium]
MLRLVALLVGLLPGIACAAIATFTPEEWSRLQRASTESSKMKDVLAALERTPDGRVVVRHASGDRGARWAEALRDWLVARGLPSARIELKPADFESERLEVDVGAAARGR